MYFREYTLHVPSELHRKLDELYEECRNHLVIPQGTTRDSFRVQLLAEGAEVMERKRLRALAPSLVLP